MPPDLSAPLQSILHRMLSPDFRHRPTIEELANSEWLKSWPIYSYIPDLYTFLIFSRFCFIKCNSRALSECLYLLSEKGLKFSMKCMNKGWDEYILFVLLRWIIQIKDGNEDKSNNIVEFKLGSEFTLDANKQGWIGWYDCTYRCLIIWSN